MQNFAGILAFMKVAHTLSFAAAARELGLSKPAVSKSISRLEAALDIKLLNRNTRTVSLTDEGRTYLATIQPLVEGLAGAADELDRYRNEASGTVRLSSTVGFGRTVLLPVLARFLDAYPRIQVDLVLEDRHADLVAEQVDIAVRNGVLADQDIVARRLAPMQMLVCGAPDYLRRRGVPATPAELEQHDCIGFRSSTTGRTFAWDFEAGGEQTSLHVRSHVTVNDVGAATELALAGHGLLQVGAYQLIEPIRAGRLVPVLTGYANTRRAHHACYKNRKHLPARVRLLLDYLSANISDRQTCLGEEELARYAAS